MPSSCASQPCHNGDRFAQDYVKIWSDSRLRNDAGRWVPIVLANGTSVETGKRIITAPIQIRSDVFEDALDFYDLAPKAIRASTECSALHAATCRNCASSALV